MTRRLALVAVTLAIAVVVVPRIADEFPHDVGGTGTILRGEAGCLAIRLDDRRDEILAIESWPQGFLVDRDMSALVDGSGAVVLRDGDRASISATLRHQTSGDIDPCNAQDRLTVHTFAVQAASSPAAS